MAPLRESQPTMKRMCCSFDHCVEVLCHRSQRVNSAFLSPPYQKLLRGRSSFNAQGSYGVDGGRTPRRNDAGNGSRKRQHSNGDGHDRHIHAGDLIKLRLDVPHAKDCHRDADSEAGDGLQHGSAHDRSDDAAARRSERHTDADLLRAAGYGIGGDAIKTDGGEQKRQQAEERSETRDEPLVDEAVVNLLLEGLELVT